MAEERTHWDDITDALFCPCCGMSRPSHCAVCGKHVWTNEGYCYDGDNWGARTAVYHLECDPQPVTLEAQA